MKKIPFLVLLFVLISALPVIGQAKELAGSWVGFAGEDELLREETDFTLLRFSADGSSLEIIETDGYKVNNYSGTLHTEEDHLLFERSDGEKEEILWHLEGEQLFLEWDWRDERAYTRMDDSLFPEDASSSPFFGDERSFEFALAEGGGLRLFDYLDDQETVEIPASVFGLPVTEIDEYAVIYKQEMKHLILPDGIRSIGYHAFEENSALEDVRLPNTLETIGEGAFLNCPFLKEVVIPEGVKVLEADTFWGGHFLEQVVLPESLNEIGADAFHGCDSVSFIVKQGSFAEQLCKENEFLYTALDDEKWAQYSSNSTSLAEIVPQTSASDLLGSWISFTDGDLMLVRFSGEDSQMKLIESSGFYAQATTGTWSTTGKIIMYKQTDEYGDTYDIEIPYNFVGDTLYLEYYGRKEFIRIDNSLFPENPDDSPFLGENRDYAISQTDDGTIMIGGYIRSAETVEIPSEAFGIPVTEIGELAFMSHDGLKKVIVPQGVVTIGNQAFSYNVDLESVELPDTLTSMGHSVFLYCPSLKEIVIPEGVTFLDVDTFFGCENLTKVSLPASLEGMSEDGVFDSNSLQSIHFIVQPGSFAEKYCIENGLTFSHPGEEPEAEPVTTSEEEVETEPEAEPVTEAESPAEEATEEKPVEEGDEELFREAMALYEDERFYSARQAFIESGYGTWEVMAENCIQPWPTPGEVWRDRSQWLQDMELTIQVDQPEGTAMFIRIIKDKAPVSYLFISGSETVTVRLPGNGYYAIHDGIGETWYGVKEAFGPEGSYESMTFDEEGTETVFLKSNHAYTLSINLTTPAEGDTVYSESEDWDNFVK